MGLRPAGKKQGVVRQFFSFQSIHASFWPGCAIIKNTSGSQLMSNLSENRPDWLQQPPGVVQWFGWRADDSESEIICKFQWFQKVSVISSHWLFQCFPTNSPIHVYKINDREIIWSDYQNFNPFFFCQSTDRLIDLHSFSFSLRCSQTTCSLPQFLIYVSPPSSHLLCHYPSFFVFSHLSLLLFSSSSPPVSSASNTSCHYG